LETPTTKLYLKRKILEVRILRFHFIFHFCSAAKRKLTEKVDLKKIIGEEVEEKLALR